MTMTRVYSFKRVKELFADFLLPTSLRRFLKREGIGMTELNGQMVYNADQVDELIKMVRL
jgi:hypothetical protein